MSFLLSVITISKKQLDNVDEDDKKDAPIQGYPGGTQQMTIINESGLYPFKRGNIWRLC